MFKLILLVFIFINNSFATDFFRRGDNFVIRSRNCIQVREEIQNLSTWKELVDGESCNIDSVRVGMNRRNCEAVITSCLPRHVVEYDGSRSGHHGPNCWNLSLVMAGILPNMRYTPQSEMSFYMQPPLCRPLENGESRRPGDVGAIRNQDGSEVHGFIYISENLAYSKNGRHYISPYRMQSLENVYDVYGIEDQNEECRSNSMPDSCEKGVEYFRCISMEEYLRENKKYLERSHLDVFEAVTSLDCMAAQYSFDLMRIFNETTMDTLATTVEIVNQMMNDLLEKSDLDSMSDKDVFILASTFQKLNGISLQLNNYKESLIAIGQRERLQRLIDSVEESKQNLKDYYLRRNK